MGQGSSTAGDAGSGEGESDTNWGETPSPEQREPAPVHPHMQEAIPCFLHAQQRILTDELAGTVLNALPPGYRPYGRAAQWLQLYNSCTNGKSFQRLVQSITEKGPTVIVIQIKDSSRLIGAFCDAEWLTVSAREKQAVSNAAAEQRASREGQRRGTLPQKPGNQSNVFFGAEPCFVFCGGGEGPERVDPSGVVYHSRSFSNSNFMYLFDTHPDEDKIGIGMGGQPGYFGWFVDRWLEKGKCCGAKCTTFQNPRLAGAESWDVGVVEVYAVKPEIVQRLSQEGAAERSCGLSVFNKNADWEADKMLLELHGVHKFDANERADC